MLPVNTESIIVLCWKVSQEMQLSAAQQSGVLLWEKLVCAALPAPLLGVLGGESGYTRVGEWGRY